MDIPGDQYPVCTPVCLVLGGFDPSGGAGVLVDVKALHDTGSRSVVVITANTVQNLRKMTRMEPTDPGFLREQLALLSEDFRVHAVKVGLVPSFSHAKVILDFLQSLPADLPVVYDPVLRASAGYDLYNGDPGDLRELIHVSSIVTPNVPELASLTFLPVDTVEQRRLAASRLLGWGARAVLVKAGHLSGADATDELLVGSGTSAEPHVIRFPMPRLAILPTRGTGCCLASQICGFLASGLSMESAVGRARLLFQERIQATWSPSGDVALF